MTNSVLEGEGLTLFVENVAVALRQMEADPPYTAQRVLELVHTRIPVSLSRLPNATRAEKAALERDQLALLALLKTYLDSQ